MVPFSLSEVGWVGELAKKRNGQLIVGWPFAKTLTRCDEL
jgi:hypothetical protein